MFFRHVFATRFYAAFAIPPAKRSARLRRAFIRSVQNDYYVTELSSSASSVFESLPFICLLVDIYARSRSRCHTLSPPYATRHVYITSMPVGPAHAFFCLRKVRTMLYGESHAIAVT